MATSKSDKVTCRCCKQKYARSNCVEVMPRYFVHNTHLEVFKETEEFKKAKFLDRVYNLNKDVNFFILQKQLDKMMEDYNFTIEGIDYSLTYYLTEKQWDTKWNLGQFLPNYYEKAKNNYKSLRKFKKDVVHKADVVIDCRVKTDSKNKKKNVVNDDF